MKKIMEIVCKQCGRHICFTHNEKFFEQEIFCSAGCVQKYKREIKEKLDEVNKKYEEEKEK